MCESKSSGRKNSLSSPNVTFQVTLEYKDKRKRPPRLNIVTLHDVI